VLERRGWADGRLTTAGGDRDKDNGRPDGCGD
jgi:hypothetical protein